MVPVTVINYVSYMLDMRNAIAQNASALAYSLVGGLV